MALTLVLLGCGSGSPRVPATTTAVPSPPSLAGATPGPGVVDSYAGAINLRFERIPQQGRAPGTEVPAAVRVYHLAPGEALQGDLGMMQTYPDAKILRLMLLLNYRQVPFHLDDRQITSSVEVELDPERERHFRLATQPLTAGYYDFALVIVVDPDNTDTDLRTRARTKDTPVLRRSVYVGAATPPTVSFRTLPSVAAGGNFSDLLFLTDREDGLGLWRGRAVAPGERLDLFLRTAPLRGNVRSGETVPGSVSVALVAFMDDQVVPIGTEAVVYVLLSPGGISTLRLSVTAPADLGTHQYFVHQFPSPYVDAILTSSVDHAFYSQSSQRVVLDVRRP